MNAQLSSTEQQQLVEESLARFLRDSYSLPQRAIILQNKLGFSREHWKFFADLGLLALPFREESGGLGGSLADVASVMRMLGKGLVVEPYLSCVLVGGKLLEQSSDATQRARWLSPLVNGELIIGLAHHERGQRRGGIETTRLTRSASEWRLDGAKFLVNTPRALDAMLVTARDENGDLRLAIVSADAQGMTTRTYRTVDGRHAGELTFENVRVSELLQLVDTQASLDHVFNGASVAVCAEALGCMQALLDTTVEYVKTRKQFGRVIGTFQTLKHRLVDCFGHCEQAESLVRLATYEDAEDWPANVMAAQAFISKYGVAVGHEAIQMHGGMGLTDELCVSHYHKRLTQIALIFGDADACVDRFTRRRKFVAASAASTALPFDVLLDENQRMFRDEVREFLNRELTGELREAVRRQTISYPERDIAVAWQRKLHAKGWLAPLWPREYGGTGWTAVQRFIFEYESAVAAAPEQIPMGFRYVGPVIAQFGSQWQKQYFLPRMLASEHYWAQGFSEPGAGSDLASIKTTARLEGDHYVVNGTKMWTTHAHFANWLFCIARTSTGEKPQQGISFILIDLTSPGVTLKPIPLLAVDHEVNQVFLDNVRVPIENLVGEPGRGWEYTKFLLEFERGATVFSGRIRRYLAQAKELIGCSAPERWQDRVFTQRLAALEHRLMAIEFMEFRMAATMRSDGAPGVGGSLTKLLASELEKDVTELALHAAGLAGLEMEQQRPMYGPNAPTLPACDLELVAAPRYLNMRVASIYGGSSEVQRGIIAKHMLGLP